MLISLTDTLVAPVPVETFFPGPALSPRMKGEKGIGARELDSLLTVSIFMDEEKGLDAPFVGETFH